MGGIDAKIPNSLKALLMSNLSMSDFSSYLLNNEKLLPDISPPLPFFKLVCIAITFVVVYVFTVVYCLRFSRGKVLIQVRYCLLLSNIYVDS
jgi:hypothetical protein